MTADDLELTGVPAPEFTVVDSAPDRTAGVPTVKLSVEVSDASGLHVYMIALHTQVQLEPSRRSHDPETKARMLELFGAPERWGVTTGSVPWMAVDMLVPGFTGRSVFTMAIPCGYDHEVAVTRYCAGLRDGAVPLDLHFNGTIYHRGPDGRLQVALVPWSATARYDMPLGVWRDALGVHYHNAGWIGLREETLGRLTDYRARHGLSSYEALMEHLLDREKESP